jgi:hypothetical protein
MALATRLRLRSAFDTWRRLWLELRKAWPAALGIAGPVAAYWLARFWSNDAANQIRYAGTVLQCFGLVLVWSGIAGTRRAFKRPPLFGAIVEWIRRVRASVRYRDHRIILGSGAATSRGGSVSARVTVRDSTVERRVDLLERELEHLRQETEKRDRAIEVKIEAASSEQRDKARQLEAGQRDLRRQLEDFAVGDSHLEIIGFWWLVFATFATSIPEELARLF